LIGWIDREIAGSVHPSRGSRRNPADGMILNRPTVALMVLCLGLILGSCGAVSGVVSDHWPRWAGGMPGDVPPRPGAPGYDDFRAHNQPNTDPAKPAATDVKTTAQPAASDNGPPGDTPIVRGGLY
jgi:hypothetical protein